jgi:hypothetical protein
MSRACWIDNFRSPNFLLQHSWVSHKEIPNVQQDPAPAGVPCLVSKGILDPEPPAAKARGPEPGSDFSYLALFVSGQSLRVSTGL